MIDCDEFQARVHQLKRERWAKMLAAEPPGRASGPRPRDQHQERLLLRLDQARLEREQPALLRRRHHQK